MNDEVFVSSIDRHFHYGDAGRAECAVCCLEANRDHWRLLARREAAEADRLRAVCDAVGAESIVAIVAERDRLRAVVDAVRGYLQAQSTFNDADGDEPQLTDQYDAMVNGWTRVRTLLDQLDASPTGEDA